MNTLHRATLLVVASCASLAAHAACTLAISPSNVSFGSKTVGALPAADTAGYKLMGQGVVNITGVCDASRTQLRLKFSNLAGNPEKKGLVRLAQSGRRVRPADANAGAMRLRLEGARVGATGGIGMREVASAATGATAASATPNSTLDVAGEGTIVEFDLSNTPPGDRKTFSVRMTATALLANGFTPPSITHFGTSPQIELLP